MKTKLIIFVLLFANQICAQSYKKINGKAILVDTHNDILMKAVDKGFVFDENLKGKSHSDLERWKKGGLDVQLFSVYCDGDAKNPFTYANRAIDTLDAVAARNPNKIIIVYNYNELLTAVKQKKIAAMTGVEGGHMIEDDLNKLDMLYSRGARYLTLTHNIAPTWATSAMDETTKPNLAQKGLTDFGRKVVQHMNELGMLIDVSHAGDQTFLDVINLRPNQLLLHIVLFIVLYHIDVI